MLSVCEAENKHTRTEENQPVNFPDSFLIAEHRRIKALGHALAGGLADLPQRAAVYFHLYEDSGRRNVFPLIAAHGALWASGYFARGMKAGRVLSLQYIGHAGRRQEKRASLQVFADAFRRINREVCAEAYCMYHFTKLYGHTPMAEALVPAPVLAGLNDCHQSHAEASDFPKAARRALFEAFFLWEQAAIVSPSVEAAVEAFDWPAVKWLAVRPKIAFSYLGAGDGLQFKDFSDKDERIERGLRAYEAAETVGLAQVEAAIGRYGIMPTSFLENTAAEFSEIRRRTGAAAAQ